METSARVVEAHAQAARRLLRERETLRPLGLAIVVAVVVTAVATRPPAGLHGTGLGVTAAVCVFAASLALATDARIGGRGTARQLSLVGASGGAAIALSALQPRGATELAGGAAVWLAVTRLPSPLGAALGVAVGVGLTLAAALAGASSAAVVAVALVSALVGLVAHFLQQARSSQETTELLLAQLQDAREQQLEAAAVAERSRIAGELHDVLAHSLSGAAIQLQGARKLAEHEHASPQLRSAIERGGELVRDGLANARHAVCALRGETVPGVAQLPALVDEFRHDLNVDATFFVEGAARALPLDAGLALYRGAQEALTNVARYAPGAAAVVVLRYGAAHTTLTVENRRAARASAGLEGAGGGRGLGAMRERVERAGGSMSAGPTADGWRVELDVPA